LGLGRRFHSDLKVKVMLIYGASDIKVLTLEQLKDTGKSNSSEYLVAHASYVYDLISTLVTRTSGEHGIKQATIDQFRMFATNARILGLESFADHFQNRQQHLTEWLNGEGVRRRHSSQRPISTPGVVQPKTQDRPEVGKQPVLKKPKNL